MKNVKPTTLSLDANILEVLKAYRLDEVLDSISRKCLTHAKDLLNAEKSTDENGNTIRVLIEFNERVQHLVRSARRKNRKAPQSTYAKVSSSWKEDRTKGVVRSKIDNDIE